MNSLIHGVDENRQLRITLSVIKENSRVTMRYSDNGKGIKDRDCEKIFEPFYTTNRQEGGSGLGLNIVYNLVHSTLNGEVTCTSEPDKKTEFVIVFYEDTLA